MNKHIELSKNAVVAFLKKSPRQFTKADIIRFVVESGIEMVNFMYPAADGRPEDPQFRNQRHGVSRNHTYPG